MVDQREFRDIGKPVVTVTFMAMTSSGEEWVGSEVTVEVYVFLKKEKGKGQKGGEEEEGKKRMEMKMVGYHDRHTSEIFPHTEHACNIRLYRLQVVRIVYTVTANGGSWSINARAHSIVGPKEGSRKAESLEVRRPPLRFVTYAIGIS